MKTLNIKQMQAADRPREKFIKSGPQSLSDAELLAILIRTGNRQMSAINLAQYLLNATGGSLALLADKSINDLIKIKGIGPAKAVEIAAAMEIGKRRVSATNFDKKTITSSSDAYWLLAPILMDLKHEEFWMVICNRANKVIETMRISSGGFHATVVDIKLVMKMALERSASGILVAHNHPSGSTVPSEEDKRLTEKISQAARLMDIRLLDHLIIAGDKYVSFADEGWL